MQSLDFAVGTLKWLSQFVLVVSATSGMFQELYLKDAKTGRRRLTRIGWVHFAGIVLGFVLFGFTELRDRQRAAHDREAAIAMEQQQQAQITKLQSVLDAQHEIESGLRTQIKQGQALQVAQQAVITNQEGQNDRLKDLLLASYHLSGVEMRLATPPLPHQRYAALFQTTRDDLRASGQAPGAKFDNYWQYFETCLEHGDFQASKGERDQWVINCRLGRPQGIATPLLYCAPDTYQWRVFEQFLDMLLGPRFSVQLNRGPDLVLLNAGSRPSTISRKADEITLTVLGSAIKLGQLTDARIVLRVDKAAAQQRELFTSITVRSLDPLVQFDVTFQPRWVSTKIGTEKVQVDADEEPRDIDIYAQLAGPVSLPVNISRNLLAIAPR